MDNNFNIHNNLDSYSSNNITSTLKYPDPSAKMVSNSKEKTAHKSVLKDSVNLHSLKKTFSQEVRLNIDTQSTGDKSLNQTNYSSTKGTFIDAGKLSQDTFKKLYNNSILKSITPKYLGNSKVNLLGSKEGFFKTYNHDSYPVQSPGNSSSKVLSTNLYQKAKNDVINNKLKLTTTKPVKHLTAFHTNVQTTKREDTPSKDELRKIVLSNLYSPTDSTIDRSLYGNISSTHAKLSKKSSVKALHIISPTKRIINDKPMQVHNTSQEKFFKKPLFKLDLSKRTPSNRDALTSSRNRNKTADKITDLLTTDSLIRVSYDQQHYSLLNNSTQRNASKKKI